jgi:Bacterial capsule synthesis protein PGA_cap
MRLCLSALTGVVVLILVAPIGQAVPADSRTFSVVLAGDVGFPGQQAETASDGIIRRGRLYPYADFLADIENDLKADFVFGNIETVVSARTDMVPNPSSYNFRTRPEAIDALIGRGFNLFSLANNHALDFGIEGAVETRTNFHAAATVHPMAASGIGEARNDLLQPQLLQRDQTTVALTAIGFISKGRERLRATDTLPGQLSLETNDFDDAVKSLSRAKADLKVLSIHYGEELVNTISNRDLLRYRPLLTLVPGTHIIAAHHAHVARAIEVQGDNVIFYGLGNFLHLGTHDMSDAGECGDFSPLARLYYRKSPAGTAQLRALEIVPIHETHWKVSRMAPQEAALRIAALNSMSEDLNRANGTRTGVALSVTPYGSGIYCRPEAAIESDRIGRLCRSLPAAAVASADGGPCRN